MNRRSTKTALYVLLVALVAGTGLFTFSYLAQSNQSMSPTVASLAPMTEDAHGAMVAYPTAGMTSGYMAEPDISSPKAPALTEGSSAPAASSLNGGTDYAPPQQYQYQEALTAGQVDDNVKYQEYLDYLSKYPGYDGPVAAIDVSQRVFVRVLDQAQMPVAGARVQLYSGDKQVFDGETMSDGRAMFLPKAAGVSTDQAFRAVISRGNASTEATVYASGGGSSVVMLPGVQGNTGAVGIDLVFLLDATGSMADEIDHIKQTVGSIAQRIEQLPGSSAPRFGLVAFRDRGDDYVTRQWDFTSDISQFSANLANVEAGGGGDIPESVSAGLHDAIHLPGWSDNSTGRHVRMIVLVGDAPPHLDYANDYSYPQLLNEANNMGIKIFPVGASNLQADGEYIFRQFAQVTQGQFVFLTYANGVSGAPGTYTDKHVSDFTVQNLDTLIVGLVAGEVANQNNDHNVDVNSVQVPLATTERVTGTSDNLAGTLDKLVSGDGAIFWGAILTVVLLVVYATRRQRPEQAPAPASAEIYVPESLSEHEYATLPKPVRLDIIEQPQEERDLVAAHIQPALSTVELRVDVQPTQTSQPTVPLR